MFSGLEIIAVEAGTEIEDGDDKLTVTDTQAVFLGRKAYMTPTHATALGDHPSVSRKERSRGEPFQ